MITVEAPSKPGDRRYTVRRDGRKVGTVILTSRGWEARSAGVSTFHRLRGDAALNLANR